MSPPSPRSTAIPICETISVVPFQSDHSRERGSEELGNRPHRTRLVSFPDHQHLPHFRRSSSLAYFHRDHHHLSSAIKTFNSQNHLTPPDNLAGVLKTESNLISRFRTHTKEFWA